MCDHTLAHFLHQNSQKNLFFVLIKNYFRISYPVLERPILFRTPKKLLKKMLIYKRCGCGCEVRPLKIGGAHTCACGPRSGHARCVRATQKMVATHALVKSPMKNSELIFNPLPTDI